MESIMGSPIIPANSAATKPTQSQAIKLKKNKRRANRHNTDITSVVGPSPELPEPCLLSKLPLELLAEILVQTRSPKDVLAVARTSKYFYNTLLSPLSVFIWRKTRQACRPRPLPDPMPNCTELSYASFLFDGGPCEACDTQTDSMYKSFAIRLRLCGKHDCKMKFLSTVAAPTASEFDRAIATLLPSVESNESLGLASVGINSSRRIFRGIDWVQEGSRYSSISPPEILNSNGERIKNVTALMKFSKALRDWVDVRHLYYCEVKSTNEAFGRILAAKHGWDYWDMINCTPYGGLHRHKNKTLQYVTHFDYDQLAPTIADILLRVSEKRQRQAKEEAYKENRTRIAQHYNRLRSKKPPLTLPTLPTFRRLPIVAMLQSSDSTSPDAAVTLKGPSWVSERLDIELNKWLDQAKGSLGSVLGFPNWKTASTTILHPATRITARFLCSYCGRLALRYREDECLDFAGACSHECRTSKCQKQRDETWDAKRFVKDDKAINAILRLAALCGADLAHEECPETIRNVAKWVLCKSCNPGIIMCSRSVVGHSHRHDDMQMELVTEAEAQDILASYPFIYGAAQNLLVTHSTAVKLRTLKNYGCRFCLAENRKLLETGKFTNNRQSQDVSLQEKIKDNNTEKAKPYKRSYTFDGMRSHLKAAHGVEHIRSEDFFDYKLPDKSSPSW